MQTHPSFDWIPFYTEFANKLCDYAADRQPLIVKIQAVFDRIGIKLPKLESDGILIDIDPFTIYGLFNKGITEENRIRILHGLAEEFQVTAPVPHSFDGVPVLMNLMAAFYRFKDERHPDTIDHLWEVFLSAIQYADNPTPENGTQFAHDFDVAMQQKGIKWNLTSGLFWIRPNTFLSLDSRNRWFLTYKNSMPEDFMQFVGNLDTVPSGERYLEIVERTKQVLSQNLYSYRTIPELSYQAWVISEQVNQENAMIEGVSPQPPVGEILTDNSVHTVHYWIYSPGNHACKWDEFYRDGIMAIGWSGIGDLKQYPTKQDMKLAMKDTFNPNLSYMNAAHATWQFANEMQPGDIVFVKKGMHTIIGKGVVTSNYIFDAKRTDDYNHIRKVNWTQYGSWPHPGQAVMKTLTDITAYTDYVEKLLDLFQEDIPEDAEEVEQTYPVYTDADFLQHVYMDKNRYDTLAALVRYKQNVILQGAPGVGKTFAAKRLAYSIMGVQDPNRVMMVQFHQSYSYEDFVMGFRPNADGGFTLKEGPFYRFCKKAEIDSDNPYFFIIDEINRGNLSKIFGELFMMIEKDKRGIPLQLLYSDELFSIPKNVYLIGMMNTADRSLAILDYALRRRFAFFDLSPAFDSVGFRTYQTTLQSDKFDLLISTVKQLNNVIAADETLGKGFCIGHSYFCGLKSVDDMLLQNIVNYELIPLLQEYWFDEPSKLQQWEQALREAIR